MHIIEPELWAQPDLSSRQYDFYIESLNDLIKNCDHQSVFFCVKVGNALDIFQQIHKKYSIKQIFSYQETWNNWTYERDINLTLWFKKVSIVWNESNQFAVFRCLKNRDGWAHKWNQLMNQPLAELLPFNDYINESSDSLPNSEILFNQKDDCNQRLIGGRANALQYLESFLKLADVITLKQCRLLLLRQNHAVDYPHILHLVYFDERNSSLYTSISRKRFIQ